jgi:hypothetical protein
MLGVLRGDVIKLFFLAALLLLATVSGAYADQYCILCHGANGPHVPQCGDTTTCGVSCHQGQLNAIMHPFGSGTPMSDVTTTTGISSSCRTCHQLPSTTHPFRINTNPGVVTQYPDLDQACGQCHGGGADSTTSPPQGGVVYLTKNQLGVAAPNLHSGSSQTVLASIDCILCHNGNPILPASVSHPTSSGTPGSGAAACRGCHAATGILHRKAAIDPDVLCGRCHGGSQGAGSEISPAPYFTAFQIGEVARVTHDSSQVSSINCDSCHATADPVAETLSAMGHPQSSITPGCLQCHTAGLHSGVTPSVTAIVNDGCSTCHGESGTAHKFTGFSDNPLVRFAAGIHTKSNPGSTCTGCHTGLVAENMIIGMNHPTLPGTTPSTCETCHWYSVILSGQTTSTFYSRPGQIPFDADHACGQCHGGSAGPGAVTHSAPYFDAATLISASKNLHSTKPTARFTWTTDPSLDYNVFFNASTSVCPSGAVCTYSMNFGDGTSGPIPTPGLTTSHVYANGTTRTAVLSVTSNLGTGSTATFSLSITPAYVASTPTAVAISGTQLSAFTATVNYTLSGGVAPYTVKTTWGDGYITTASGIASGASSTSHTYANAGTYTVTVTATDTGVNGAHVTTGTANTVVTIAQGSYTISGKVTRADGVTPVSSASVTLKQNGVTKKLVYTNSSGDYTMTSVAPGTYTMTVAKSGLTFANPAATLTVTSSNVVQNIRSLN